MQRCKQPASRYSSSIPASYQNVTSPSTSSSKSSTDSSSSRSSSPSSNQSSPQLRKRPSPSLSFSIVPFSFFLPPSRKRLQYSKASFQFPFHILLSLWTLLLLISYFLLLFQQQQQPQQSLFHFSDSSTSPFHTYIRNSSLSPFRSPTIQSPTFELFTAPKPFIGIDRRLNERAIRSWLSIPHITRITLLGNEKGYVRAARRFGLEHVRYGIDTTFLNVPLFHSLMNAAMTRSNSTISIFVNGDILLDDDVIQSLKKCALNFKHFVAVAARFDINRAPRRKIKRKKFILQNGVLHSYGGIDLWAWTNNGPSLIRSGTTIPPFIFGRGRYDNWLTHEMISSKQRQVIDISESAVLGHVRHDYKSVEKSVGKKLTTEVKNDFWAEGKHAKFELFINVYLSLHSGTYSYQKGSPLYTQWKTIRCLENDDRVCLVKRTRPGVCPCESAPFVSETMTDPTVTIGQDVIKCGRVVKEYMENYTIPVTIDDGKSSVRLLKSRGLMMKNSNDDDDDDDVDNDDKKSSVSDDDVKEEDIPFGLPFTVQQLSKRVAINGTIILTAVTHAYRTMLMNWVCNLRMLNMKNFMIAALDKDLYRYAFLRSLPVFHDDMIHNVNLNNEKFMQAEYGSDAFRAVTKLKTRVVRHVLLQTGYDVLWCDVDIILFRNPISYMHSLPGDIIIQSNAPDHVELNRRRRLNSGFYLIHNNLNTLHVLKEIIVYAARAPHLSEQPCVYDVLCGTHAEHSRDENRCVYNQVTTYILQRELFPNGITQSMWNTTNGLILQTWPDLYIIHNNWIVGQRAKWERFKRHGFIFFDRETNLCTYPDSWQ